MRVKVTLKLGKELVGEVIKREGYNNDRFYVDVDGCQYKFTRGTNIKIEGYTMKDKFLLFASDNNIDFDGFGDGQFIIENHKYTIDIVFYDEHVHVDTVLKSKVERLSDRWSDNFDPSIDPYEEATANRKKYKTFRGVKNYIERFYYCD